jgi:cyclic pyranopterin phosphate synthase
MLQDSFGRVHNYLRISLTDNCNLRCFYCMPDEQYTFAPAARLMQPREIEALAAVFVAQGVNKIRLTGGEPFVRKDASEIIRLLSKLKVELACTSNGVRINEVLDDVLKAQFSSINISLDTLSREKFERITRRDLFDRVRANIDLLVAHGVTTKINVVVMKGLNDDEIPGFIELTKHLPVDVRFIEFMPFQGNRWTGNQVFTLKEILERVGESYDFSPLAGSVNDTAKRYAIPGHKGNFAVISTMSAPFCEGCNRLRLTADGKLKNCLFSKTETDLLSALRRGEEISPLIAESVRSKASALGGQMDQNFEMLDAAQLQNRSMITIGG